MWSIYYPDSICALSIYDYAWCTRGWDPNPGVFLPTGVECSEPLQQCRLSTNNMTSSQSDAINSQQPTWNR